MKRFVSCCSTDFGNICLPLLRTDHENFEANQNKTRFSGLVVCYVIKILVHAFSFADIELWMHLGSLEST